MSDTRRRESLNPAVIAVAGFAMLLCMATGLWLGSRINTAYLYGLIRQAQFPWINERLPYAGSFTREALLNGHVPPFEVIYLNSLFYGAFFSLLTFTLLFLAVNRLQGQSIRKFVVAPSKHGRSFEEVMERYAAREPHVRFFLDYDTTDLPTTHGTARQPLTALETLIHAGAIEAIVVDSATKTAPTLRVDSDALATWFAARFGPVNPFLRIEDGLSDLDAITGAVDALAWDVVLILYPALHRLQAFHLESDAGYDKVRDRIDAFHASVWEELNTFKTEFGEGIELGYADEWDRAEREARYALARTPKPRRGFFRQSKTVADGASEYEPFSRTDPLTPIQIVHRAGQLARGEMDDDTARLMTPPDPGQHPDRPSRKTPPRLLFFGEVLAKRGPELRCVETARDGLRTILTRHLGNQVKEYPVRIDDEGVTQYAPRITTQQESAFNQQAQNRLNVAAREMTRILFGHSHQFGIVGSALDKTREAGIMPPNLFRFLRFSPSSEALWWFVHNLGMPSAVPENSALFEHYQAERLIGMPLASPYIDAAVDGLRQEAERYLVPQTVEDLAAVLGGKAMVDAVTERRDAEKTRLWKLRDGEITTRGPSDLVGAMLRGQDDPKETKARDGGASSEVEAEASSGDGRTTTSHDRTRTVEEEHGIPALDALLDRVTPAARDRRDR